MASETESEKRETLADIVACLRANAKRFIGGHGVGRCEGGRMMSLADRIVAAWRREKSEIEADALAVGGIVEAARKLERESVTNSHGFGNAEAMREALDVALMFIESLEFEPYSPLDEAASELRQRIMDALSAPAPTAGNERAMTASDMKELRVILDNINELNDEWFDTFPTDEGQTCIHDSLEYEIIKADKILGKRPRQCDVGTPEEQGERCMAQFDQWRRKGDGKKLITAIMAWAQTPYESQKGAGK